MVKWKQLLLVSILLGLTISLTNSEVPENESKSREKRSGMLSSPLDLEDVRQAVFSPMTISNQFSATFGINGMRLIGWTTGGLLYYILTNYVQMSPETRETISRLDVLFEEQNVATRLAGVMRGFMFNMPPRVLYNYVTNPVDTAEEFRNVTVKEVVDRTLSDGFRRRFILIFWFQYFSKLVGWSSLYYYSTLAQENCWWSQCTP